VQAENDHHSHRYPACDIQYPGRQRACSGRCHAQGCKDDGESEDEEDGLTCGLEHHSLPVLVSLKFLQATPVMKLR